MKLVVISLLSFILISPGSLVAEDKTYIALTEPWPPYQTYIDGKSGGYSVEFIRAIFKRAGLKVNIKVLPWARSLTTTQNEKDIFLFVVARNEKRENSLIWIDTILPYTPYFWKLKSRKEITVNSVENAKNYMVGVVTLDASTQYLQKQGFEIHKNMTAVTYNVINLRKLYKSRVDLIVYDIGGLAIQVEAENLDPSLIERQAMIKDLAVNLWLTTGSKSDPDLVEKIRQASKTLKEDGTYDKIMGPAIKLMY
ncbi:MAG: transporter substrate-binding domain-containing protein [Bermanella sp.]